MSFLCRLGALALFAFAFSAQVHAGGRPPQYVIISFDGALHISQWERSRALARRTGAAFTYFLSCVYLLSPQTRKAYQGPGMAAGRSNVGNGFSRDDVAARLGQIWRARAEGHEIASHGCGHFDGKDWTKADWQGEFAQFRTILRDAWTMNDIAAEPAGWRAFAQNEISGFRAPYLSTGPALYAALADDGFEYDASAVSRGPVAPQPEKGVMRFSLPLIPEGPSAKRIIAMDYNLYVRHSGGLERPSQADAFEKRAYQAFKAAFDDEYAGRRTPLQIGFHFTLMNDGAYWRALERFAQDVCRRAQVRCISYSRYLELHPDLAARNGGKVGG